MHHLIASVRDDHRTHLVSYTNILSICPWHNHHPQCRALGCRKLPGCTVYAESLLNSLLRQFSKQAKPIDLENRLDGSSVLSSGMNTPVIVDGASQVPLSRSIGRMRGLSTSVGHAEQSNGTPPSSRARRSSIAKGENGMLGDSLTTPDALLPPPTWSSSSAGPIRRNSARSARSEHSANGDGKYNTERLEHVEGGQDGSS